MTELRGFQKRGCAVWLLAHPGSEIFRRAQKDGINVKAVDFDRQKLPVELVRLVRWLHRENVQVVNTHSSRDGWLLGLAARLARTQMVIRSRHIDVQDRHPALSRHKFVTLSDHALTTSEKITCYLRDTLRVEPTRITTLPTGIDLDHFSPRGGRAELPVDTHAGPVVGMVSVLRSWKGHAVYFDAIRHLREAGHALQHVVVGGGASAHHYPALAEKHGVADCLRFTGHREDVADVLRALDVLCIPSIRHEGVPQIGLQALACGTAVVGSDCGGIPEIIREGETGRIFPNGDAAALAARIAETVTDTAATERLKKNGRRLVEERHGVEAMLDRLEQLYARHITAHGAPRH